MGAAYLDTSCVLAILFDEPTAPETRAVLEAYEELVASNLLEAELRSALAREGWTRSLPSCPKLDECFPRGL